MAINNRVAMLRKEERSRPYGTGAEERGKCQDVTSLAILLLSASSKHPEFLSRVENFFTGLFRIAVLTLMDDRLTQPCVDFSVT